MPLIFDKVANPYWQKDSQLFYLVLDLQKVLDIKVCFHEQFMSKLGLGKYIVVMSVLTFKSLKQNFLIKSSVLYKSKTLKFASMHNLWVNFLIFWARYVVVMSRVFCCLKSLKHGCRSRTSTNLRWLIFLLICIFPAQGRRKVWKSGWGA